MDQRRFAMCNCGIIYDLETGLKIDTPAIIKPDKSKGDKEQCFACWLESKDRQAWPHG